MFVQPYADSIFQMPMFAYAPPVPNQGALAHAMQPAQTPQSPGAQPSSDGSGNGTGASSIMDLLQKYGPTLFNGLSGSLPASQDPTAGATIGGQYFGAGGFT